MAYCWDNCSRHGAATAAACRVWRTDLSSLNAASDRHYSTGNWPSHCCRSVAASGQLAPCLAARTSGQHVCRYSSRCIMLVSRWRVEQSRLICLPGVQAHNQRTRQPIQRRNRHNVRCSKMRVRQVAMSAEYDRSLTVIHQVAAVPLTGGKLLAVTEHLMNAS